jgi:NADH-quinone oxidoreductase subunit M
MLGEVTNEENKNIKDMNRREHIYMIPIIAMIFFIGLYPKPIINMLKPAVENVIVMMKKGEILKGSEGPLALARIDRSSRRSKKEVHVALLGQENKNERDGNGYYPNTD